MQLHRSRDAVKAGRFFLALSFGCLIMALVLDLGIVAWIIAIIGMLLGAAMLANGVKPFRFHISEHGLDLHHGGIERRVPWAEVDAVVLEQPTRVSFDEPRPAARLLLVPAPGSALPPSTHRSPVDGRPAVLLLEVDSVTESADDIAAAFARLAGARFVDVRSPRLEGVETEFTVILRGYDRREVDELISAAQRALASDQPAERGRVKARLDGTRPAVVNRGYDKSQVDDTLRALSAHLAAPTG